MAGGHDSHGGHGHGAGLEHDLLAGMGYETRDVDPRTILSWIGALFVFVFLTSLLTLGMYRLFVPADLIAQTRAEGRTRQSRVPLQPQVQVDPKRDMRMFRQAEEAALVGGAMRGGNQSIPVDAAIERLAQDGISGVRGTEVPGPGQAYPGSGIYDAPGAGTGRGFPVTGSTATSAASGAAAADSEGAPVNVPSDGEAAPAANTDNQQFRMMYGGER